jgi:hypothetical protein
MEWKSCCSETPLPSGRTTGNRAVAVFGVAKQFNEGDWSPAGNEAFEMNSEKWTVGRDSVRM